MESTVVVCDGPADAEHNSFRTIDRRMVLLEHMSAECGALLAKVSIKQSRLTGPKPSVLSLDQLTLISK